MTITGKRFKIIIQGYGSSDATRQRRGDLFLWTLAMVLGFITVNLHR